MGLICILNAQKLNSAAKFRAIREVDIKKLSSLLNYRWHNNLLRELGESETGNEIRECMYQGKLEWTLSDIIFVRKLKKLAHRIPREMNLRLMKGREKWKFVNVPVVENLDMEFDAVFVKHEDDMEIEKDLMLRCIIK